MGWICALNMPHSASAKERILFFFFSKAEVDCIVQWIKLYFLCIALTEISSQRNVWALITDIVAIIVATAYTTVSKKPCHFFLNTASLLFFFFSSFHCMIIFWIVTNSFGPKRRDLKNLSSSPVAPWDWSIPEPSSVGVDDHGGKRKAICT